MIIVVVCQCCQTEHTIVVPEEDYTAWICGNQDSMPYLAAEIRELLISNFCGTCFDKLFAET